MGVCEIRKPELCLLTQKDVMFVLYVVLSSCSAESEWHGNSGHLRTKLPQSKIINSLAVCVIEFSSVREAVTWSQAQTSCAGLQGSLASVMNDNQARMIVDVMPEG